MRNYSGSVSILPQIAIYCKRLKKLMQEELPYSTDLVFVSHLGYLTSRKQFRDRHSPGASFEPSVCEISAAIKDYVLPIFELFGDLDLRAETKKFYKEFLYYDLSDDEFNYILNSLDPKGK